MDAMRNPEGDAEPGAAPPRDWSSLDAYGNADQRWRRYKRQTRHMHSARSSPARSGWSISTVFHLVLILAVGVLAILIIVLGMPRSRNWVEPGQVKSGEGTAGRGWLEK